MNFKYIVIKGLIWSVFGMSSCLKCLAGVSISEVMPCNLSTLMNDDYSFESFIELKNDSASYVDLRDYTFVQYKKNGTKKWQYRLSQSLSISPGSLFLVWADGDSTYGHIPYKLDTDGGSLVLKYKDETVDSLYYTKQVPHLSYGRKDAKVGYMLPSPKEDNAEPVATLSRSAKPVFSEVAGIKSSNFNLAITASDSSTIYYTTDGSNPYPSHGGRPYSMPIPISATTIVRAVVFDSAKVPSEIVTQSFIFEDTKHKQCGGFTVPIVSLSTDKEYLSDDKVGMIVVGSNGISGPKSCTSSSANYNRDWKRPLNFEYFVDGKQVVSREVEAAVEGGCSRTNAVKSLSLKTSKKSGDNEFLYHFFQSKPDVIHQTIHLRNGGTAYNKDMFRFRDGLNQTLAIGMNVDYQAYQPVAYYLNGEYQGLMGLNERTNVDYLKANYDLDEDEVDFLSVSDVSGVTASKGSVDAYKELVSFLENTDAASPDFYAGACRRIDMDEYVDYQCFQQYIANTDWPGNNTKIWRERKADGRFRWIIFDTDFGLGMPGYSFLGGSDNNMIKWCRGEEPYIQWGNNQSWMTTIFKHLSNNPDFNKKFTTKFLIHLASTFSYNRIESVCDSIASLVDNEYCATFNDNDVSYVTDGVADMKTFAHERSGFILPQLQEFMATGAARYLNLSANVDGVMFTINGERVNGFEGQYLSDFESEFRAYAPMGYSFDHWEISDSAFSVTRRVEDCSSNLPGLLVGSLVDSCHVTAIFTKSKAKPTLVINEVCASSDSLSGTVDGYNSYPDWIEVYNYGDESVDMAGFYFSNRDVNKLLSQLPYGSDSTIVRPRQHKLVWAKGNATDGPLYLNFKMDVDNPRSIYLSNADGTFISSAFYMSHQPNASYGFQTDNSGEWTLFDHCDSLLMATPRAANGSVNCTRSEIPLAEVDDDGIVLSPNPAYDYVDVNSADVLTAIEIRDVKGLLVLADAPNSNTKRLDVSHLSQGIYLVSLKSDNSVVTRKLVIR